MVEESRLGDAGFADDLVDRGRREALMQHRILRDVHDPLARLLAFAERLSLNAHLIFLQRLVRSSRKTVPQVQYLRSGSHASVITKSRPNHAVTRVTLSIYARK